MKKYFVKDESIDNIDKDKFRVQDIAYNLEKIVENNKEPFNIAIIGKWGIGKSSLLKITLDILKRKGYKCFEINAWKYEKDEIGKALILELWRNIKDKPNTYSFELLQKEHNDNLQFTINRNKEGVSWSNVLVPFMIIVAITLGAFLMYCGISNYYYNAVIGNFWVSSVIRYFKNIPSLLFAPIIVWGGKIYLDRIQTLKTDNYHITYPIETQGDYEICLKEILKDNNDKIVVTLEDLDRLSSDKILEALDALKVFLEYEKFVFIVPFDDEILKRALEKRLEYDDDNKYDAALVIEKLFQFKIYMPQFMKADMREFAIKIINEDCIDFVNEYLNGDFEAFNDICRRILIHTDVETPRQVKNILNLFIENVMIAKSREMNEKVSRGFVTNEKGLQTIAKISVLQNDYNKVYDMLYEDSLLLSNIVEIFRGGEISSESIASMFFTKENEVTKIKNEYKSLINYLLKTEGLGYENIQPYLFYSQSPTGVVVGDKRQQDFIDAVKSSNVITAREMLKKTPILASALNEHIMNMSMLDAEETFITTVGVFDCVEENYRRRIANTLNGLVESILKSGHLNLKNIEYGNLYLLFNCVKSDKYNLIVKELADNVAVEDFAVFLKAIKKIRDYLNEDTKIIVDNKVNYIVLSEDTDFKDVITAIDDWGEEDYYGIYGKSFIDVGTYNYIDVEHKEVIKEDLARRLESAIAIYIDKNNIVEIEQMIVKLLSVDKFVLSFNEILDSKKWAKIENQNAVAYALVSKTYTEESVEDAAYDIMSKLSYTIDDNLNEVIDTFFCEAVTNRRFLELVLAYLKNNTLGNISNTINTFIDNFVQSNGYEDDIKGLYNKLLDDHRTLIWSKISNRCKYATNRQYDDLAAKIEVLNVDTNYLERVVEIVRECLLPSFSAGYRNKDYYSLTISIVGKVLDKLTADEIDNYAGLIANAISLYPESAVNIYCEMGKNISARQFIKDVGALLDAVNTENYKTIYEIMVSKRNCFSKENNNLEQLRDFLVKNVGLSDEPENVIEQLAICFRTISDVPELLINLQNIELDNEYVSSKIAKFINGITKNVIVGIMNDAKNYNREKTICLIADSKYGAENIWEELYSNQQTSVIEWRSVFEFYQGYIKEEIANQALLVIEKLLNDASEKDIHIVILRFIESMSGEDKKDEARVMAKIFKDSTSNEIKRKCAELFVSKKIQRQLVRYLTKEEREEYKALLIR